MTDDASDLGVPHGDWYYCFVHQRVESSEECDSMDRAGPYPTRDEAENWRQRVAERNQAWDDQDDE